MSGGKTIDEIAAVQGTVNKEESQGSLLILSLKPMIECGITYKSQYTFIMEFMATVESETSEVGAVSVPIVNETRT